MAAFQLVTIIAALAIVGTSCSANTVPGSSTRTSLLTLVSDILDQAARLGGIDVITLQDDGVQISDLAVLLRDNLPESGSPLAVALNNLVNAAHVLVGVSDSDTAALTSAFDGFITTLQDVRGLLSEAGGAVGGQTAPTRRRRNARAECCSCCGASACGDSCSCSCGNRQDAFLQS